MQQKKRFLSLISEKKRNCPVLLFRTHKFAHRGTEKIDSRTFHAQK
jgi:hypothetical protein